ncbi:MAG: hypothetical protein KDA86_25915 [Planctomycetaceae bacterium]|nr:hypothetical protein [Planctomycetaceae bacterium]
MSKFTYGSFPAIVFVAYMTSAVREMAERLDSARTDLVERIAEQSNRRKTLESASAIDVPPG